jgi:hypothetical protein
LYLNKKNLSINYLSNDENFHLTPSCINSFIPQEKNNTIFIKVKNNPDCSGKFNTFWKNNVGKKASVSFNKNFLIKNVNIYSPIKIENGFYQAVDSALLLKEIVDSFN